MKQVAHALLRASQLNSRLTGNPELTQFTDQIKALGCGIFRLVIMGEIKKGKSSFINALLGVKDLVPTASDVATSTVYKIHYGKEQRYRVFFEKETEKTPLIITSDELADYGTENGNPGNEKRVDFIEVAYPAPLLRSGLVIIDTPGLGGLFKEHKKITWQYVPKADAVFFVTDSVESPIGAEEIGHLKTVLNITPHLFFVQTKASAVDKEAREARRQNNLSILSRAFNTPKEHIPYFVVDSLRKFSADEGENLKKLERSGYPELMSYVNGKLLMQKHRILAGKAVSMAIPMLSEIRNNLTSRKEALAADTEEKQQQAKNVIAAAENELQQWQRDHLPELRTTIIRRFDDLKTECENTCAQFRPNGQLYAMLEDYINAAEDKESLARVIAVIQEKLPESVAACMIEVQQKLERGVADIMRILRKEANSGNEAISIDCTSQQRDSQLKLTENQYLVQAYNSLVESGSIYNELSRGAIGGGVGMSVGSLVGSIVGSVIPGLGTAIGSVVGGLIGSIWGGYAAGVDLAKQELKQAKIQTINALNKNLVSVYNDIMTELRNLTKHFNNSVEDVLSRAVKQHTAELRKTHTELMERARMSAAEISAAKNELARDEAQLRAIMKTIEPWIPALAGKD